MPTHCHDAALVTKWLGWKRQLKRVETAGGRRTRSSQGATMHKRGGWSTEVANLGGFAGHLQKVERPESKKYRRVQRKGDDL